MGKKKEKICKQLTKKPVTVRAKRIIHQAKQRNTREKRKRRKNNTHTKNDKKKTARRRFTEKQMYELFALIVKLKLLPGEQKQLKKH